MTRRSSLLRLIGLAAIPLCGTFPALEKWEPVKACRNRAVLTSEIQREMLKVLKNNLVMARAINQEYEAEFKIGSTIIIKRPERYSA